MSKRISEIAEHVGGRVIGDATTKIQEVASIQNAQPYSLVWADSEKNLTRALEGLAACIITSESLATKTARLTFPEPKSKSLILVDHPRLAFAQAVALFHPVQHLASGIDTTARISSTAHLGLDVGVGPQVVIESGARIGDYSEIAANCFIGAHVALGDACRLYPNVTLYSGVTLGARCIVHAGAVIGSDGFGFVPQEGRYHKFPQVGTVVIGDDVEIGANTTIDRGALDATRIGRGTKIDNLVQIAHNVEIGEDVVIAAQTGISGGTVIEDCCVIGGQVGLGDHARLKRGVVVGSKGGILPGKIVRAGQVVWGIPAIPLDEYKVLHVLWRGLPKIKEDIQSLKLAVKSRPSTRKKAAQNSSPRRTTSRSRRKR